MGPIQATKTVLRKTFVFSGRASRTEFWWFAAPVCLLTAIPVGLTILPDASVRNSAVLILVLIVSASVTSVGVRRIHDIGVPGALFSIPLWIGAILYFGLKSSFVVPYIFEPSVGRETKFSWSGIGSTDLWLICLFAPPAIVAILSALSLLPSQPGPNKYGPNPHEVTP